MDSDTPPAPEPQRHVLVAEDEPHLARLLATLLDQRDIRVTVTTTGPDTLRRLRDDPTIRLVLLDLMLPGLDGLEVLERMRETRRGADAPEVLVLTGRGEPDLRERALALGARDYLTKPFSPRGLMTRIAELV